MSICFCAMGCALNPMADPGVFGWDCSCWCHDRKPANAYEVAIDRMETARADLAGAREKAERILLEAEAEYEAAETNLRQYETSPGIPRPEYRQEVSA